MFSHQKLLVYQLSVSYLAFARRLLQSLPPGNGDLANQFRRASFSITLNIAEGAGKTGKNDKKRFYSIARGSTLECAAILDVLRAFNLGEEKLLADASRQLEEIAAMLSCLILR